MQNLSKSYYQTQAAEPAGQIKVWDPLVRIFTGRWWFCFSRRISPKMICKPCISMPATGSHF